MTLKSSLKKTSIGLGSNLGESLLVLREAWRSLGRQKDIQLVALSSPYRSEPVDMKSSHWFINAAGCVVTSLQPRELLDLLLDIEKRFGRPRHDYQTGYQDRILDLDLLFYDNEIINEQGLIIPHPLAHSRLFVMAPLDEIIPDFKHPVYQQTIRELYYQLKQGPPQPEVKKITWRDEKA